MAINWKNLQNGSDIRGVALPLVKGEDVNLTPSTANIIGSAFVTWLSNKKGHTPQDIVIGVGMDSRISGPELKTAIIEGIVSKGCTVLDFGLATTPSMFMSTQFDSTACTGAIMLTASHLPPNRNGMKFFTSVSGLEKKDITAILNYAETNQLIPDVEGGMVLDSDILTPYSDYLVQFIRENTNERQPLEGLNIIVDAGNGAGGFFAENILEPLGANISGSQYLEPDGRFPNHVPNPEDKEAMQSVCNAVINNNADLGIIFDTDVDRSAIVDETGRPINRNALIALLAAIVLEEHPGSYIVTDSVTSDGLAGFITKSGGIHHRFKRGYRNVINESVRLNQEGKDSWLAIETSGHGAMKENFNLDDGAYMVAKALIKMAQLKKEGKKLTSLIEQLEEPAESEEYRIQISSDDYKAYGNSVIEELGNYSESIDEWKTEPENYEGIRVKCKLPKGKSGWFLLRLSLHDPILPLNIESDEEGGVEHIKQLLRPFFNKFSELKNASLT